MFSPRAAATSLYDTAISVSIGQKRSGLGHFLLAIDLPPVPAIMTLLGI